MPAVKFKHIATMSIMLGALAYLGVAAYRAGIVYYISVDAVLSQPEHLGTRVRVYGLVASETKANPDAASRSVSDGLCAFELRGTDATSTRLLKVQYHGPVPDGFATGREVVVEGLLKAGDYLDADVLMTKCSSKYQRAQPGNSQWESLPLQSDPKQGNRVPE